MARECRLLALGLAATLALAAGGTAGASPLLDQAVKKYYAGRSAEAIEMIRPLALAGDAEAQYLLGNILYTLASSGQGNLLEDPSTWYRMAAAQDSAPANYALGVIHNNRWLRSHRDEDAALARSYLQRALELGEPKARAALDRLAGYLETERDSVSLRYSNADFASGSTPESQAKAPQRGSARAKPAGSASAGLGSSGDPVAEAERLRDLLQRLQDGAQPVDIADAGALTGMLGGFESIDQLIADIARLLENVEEASRLDTAPGSN